MIKDDGTVMHFNNPKVQASLAANTFAVTGHTENKRKFTLISKVTLQKQFNYEQNSPANSKMVRAKSKPASLDIKLSLKKALHRGNQYII